MKRNLILQAALAAAFSLAASSASAVVSFSTTTASTPAPYASELLTDGITLDAVTTPSTALDLAFSPTWGVAAGNHLYVRIDLTNGKFKDAAMTLTSTTGTTVVALSAGGGVGDTYVIYDVSDPAVGVQLTNALTLKPKKLTLVSAGSDITAQIRFYTDASAASNATTATVGTALNDKYVTKVAGIKSTFTPLVSTATVADSFKKFGGALFTPIGSVTSAVSTTALVPSTSAVVNANGSDLATASKLVVTGQFDAADTTALLGLSATAGCLGQTAGTLNAAKTTATFAPFALTATNLVPAKAFVCYNVNGTTAIPAQTVAGVLSFTVAAGAVVPDVSSTVGTIVRNGAETFALNITAPGNADSTFVRVSNVGTDHGLVKGTLYSEAGAVLGSGTLIADMLAGSTTVFSSDAIATAMGVTTWTGRAKLQIIGEVNKNSLRVQNLIRSGGILTNMGADTSTNNN